MMIKTTPPTILDEAGSKNLLNQIKKLHIQPEIEKRRKSGKLPDEFEIRKCLIQFLPNRVSTVKFNQECELLAIMRKPHDVKLEKNQPVYTYQVKEFIDVKLPTVDGIRTPFILMIRTRENWHMFFDRAPNQDDNSASDRTLGKIIASTLQQSLEEETIMITAQANNLIGKIGLWCAPSLVPYPLNKIVKHLSENDNNGAIKALLDHCNDDFLSQMTSRWVDISVFEKRSVLINAAVSAHSQEHYVLVIHALLPHIEGIVTDWLEGNGSILRGQKKKLDNFSSMLLKNTKSGSFAMITRSALEFIRNSTFEQFEWSDNISVASPKRNVVGHGKYIDDMYTEKNSIAAFLLLDTLYYLISTIESMFPQSSSDNIDK